SLRQDDRQQAVFEAVVVENIGKTRRDDGAKAIFIQRPGRVFAAGATTEVFLGDQNAGTLVARLVQLKPGVQRTLAVVLAGLAFVQIAPLVKQVFTKTGALDGFQKLLGYDLVGIDVGTIQRSDQTLMLC